MDSSIPHSVNDPFACHDALERPMLLYVQAVEAPLVASLLQRNGAERAIHLVGGRVPKRGNLGKPIERPDTDRTNTR